MATTKYGSYIKSLSFQDCGPGSYKQGTTITGDYLGLDVHVEYGAYWSAGRIGKEPSQSETHDFNEVMIWMGSDMSDLSELGAEVHICLGEERKPMFSPVRQLFLFPKGFPICPSILLEWTSGFSAYGFPVPENGKPHRFHPTPNRLNRSDGTQNTDILFPIWLSRGSQPGTMAPKIRTTQEAQ